MTDKQLDKALELKSLIETCDRIISFEKDNTVWLCSNNVSFMRTEIFNTVKNKKAELEREYSEL